MPKVIPTTRKQELQNIFEDAINFHAEYVAVLIKMEGFENQEIIINSKPNIQSKLDYYLGAYNEDLIHNVNKGIKIVDFTYAETFEEIECYFELNER